MAARKHRRVLLEVINPPPRSTDPSVKPRPAAPPPERPRPTPVGDFASGPAALKAQSAVGDDDKAGQELIAVSRSTLAIVAAVVVVLVVVSFSAGTRYGVRQPASPGDGNSAQEAQPEAISDSGAPEAVVGQADEIDSDGARASDDKPATPVAAKTPDAEKSPPPRASLLRGYHYVVVQHINKSQSRTAGEIVRYLSDHGIAAALLRGSDIRIVATEPFLINQEDAAKSRREQKRANQLLARVKEVGKQMNREWAKLGRKGYTLSGCYLEPIK